MLNANTKAVEEIEDMIVVKNEVSYAKRVVEAIGNFTSQDEKTNYQKQKRISLLNETKF